MPEGEVVSAKRRATCSTEAAFIRDRAFAIVATIFRCPDRHLRGRLLGALAAGDVETSLRSDLAVPGSAVNASEDR